MKAKRDNHKTQLTEIAKAVGAILGVPLALFTVVNSIIAQPVVSLVVALIAAALASVWLVLSRGTDVTQIIIAWLALAVVVLASFVIWPRTMTVEGFIYDMAGNPVSKEKVIFFDRSGRRYEAKTNAEGFYQFVEVPSGKYRLQVQSTEVGGETRGILVRVVQQNLTVSPILAAVSPTGITAITPDKPIDTPILSTNTPAPESPTLVQVLFDEAHDEWISIEDNLKAFADDLRVGGYSVSHHTSGPLTPELLANSHILVIGTAWGEFTDAELDTIQQFVSNGGGLFLTGVGWSWVNPDKGRTLDNYPMNRVAALFDLHFLDDVICDPTNHYGDDTCMPLFSTMAGHPVTSGVTTVGGPIGPCPLERLNGAPQAIIFGDADAYSSGDHYPAGTNPPVMMAVEYGAGRVVALGHEGYLVTVDYDNDGRPNRDDYDNIQLGLDIIDWLGRYATTF